MNDTLKKILILVGIVILGVIGYFLFIDGDEGGQSGLRSTTEQTGQDNATAQERQQMNQEFVSTLLSLNALELDAQLFSQPAFQQLKDYSVTLVPEAGEGRPNPFAPLGLDEAPATDESATAE